MDNSLLIEASGIGVAFGGRAVLNDVGIAVPSGGIVTLIGPNGAGKTTLVRVMLGLQRPDRGKVARRPGLTVGYMPQSLEPNPSLPMTVGRFMAISVPRVHAEKGKRMAALDEVGAAHIHDSPLAGISGGELRRVMLARALLRNPDLLVLDEPAQGVDIGGQADLYRLIGRIRDDRGCGVLMVSHDLHLVMAATDHVICLNHHVCCAGHPETVSRDPAFITIFGERAAVNFAVYHHHHDHGHDADGKVVSLNEAAGGEGEHG